MAGFLNRLFVQEPKSASKAKERMKLVLIHDRTDITPASLELLKDEIIGVISRHVDIDPDLVRVEMSHEGRQQRLIADIPLLQSRKRRIG